MQCYFCGINKIFYFIVAHFEQKRQRLLSWHELSLECYCTGNRRNYKVDVQHVLSINNYTFACVVVVFIFVDNRTQLGLVLIAKSLTVWTFVCMCAMWCCVCLSINRHRLQSSCFSLILYFFIRFQSHATFEPIFFLLVHAHSHTYGSHNHPKIEHKKIQ